MIARALTEFVGTFFLVLTIGLVGAMNVGAMGPIAVGAVLCGMIYMGATISGAHYNPAATLTLALRGAVPKRHLAPYLASQCTGAVLGALAAHAVGDLPVPMQPARDASAALLVEALFTFLMCLTILNVAINPAARGNGYYGAAIALVVVGGAYVAGPISGAAFNPAVALGLAAADALHGTGQAVKHLWVYLVGPTAGAAFAAGAYGLQHKPD